MLRYLEEDTPRGDLARDMQYEQERSPWNTRDLNEYTSWDKFRNNLEFHHACDECIQTARICWQELQKPGSSLITGDYQGFFSCGRAGSACIRRLPALFHWNHNRH